MRILDFSDGFESSSEPTAVPFPASEVEVTPSGNLASTDAQSALEELQLDIDQINDDISALPASNVVVTPSGNLSSVNAQLALQELQGDIDSINADYGAANGLATLDGSGKVPTAQLPSIVFVDVYAVADIPARDTLTVQEGDVAIVADAGSGVSKTYVYDGTSWLEMVADGSLTAHISDTSTHGVTGAILGTSDAQVVTNKDIDGGTASNTNRITVPKNTKTNLDALTRKEGTILYATDTQKLYKDNGTILEEVGTGSGSGGIFPNNIDNSNAETDTTGWATYADAPGTRPVNGTGGSPTVTLTRTTSTPLRDTASFLLTKDAANRQGEGASYNFTIARTDRYKVHSIVADYEIASGTFVAGNETTDSDLIFYIYDVDNSQLIEPTPFRLFSNTEGTFNGTFQATGSTNYRLIIHVASTSASAYTVKFDNIHVTRNATINASLASDWTSFTPTGSWSTNTTYNGKYRRVGDSLEVHAQVAVTGAPTSATLTINLPSGLSIDTSKLPSDLTRHALGIGMIIDAGTNTFHSMVRYNSTTSVQVNSYGASGTYSDEQPVTQAVPMTFANGDLVTVSWKVPISGWASQTQTSNQSQNRRITLKAGKNSGNHATSGSELDVASWDTIGEDSVGGFNSSTGIYTVPEAGDYLVTGAIMFVSNSTGGRYVFVQKNGTGYEFYGAVIDATSTAALTTSIPFCGIVKCNAGDNIRVKAWQSSGGALNYVTDQSYSSSLNIHKIQAPLVTLPTETVAVSVYRTTNQSIAGSGTVIFNNKYFDTHSAFNTSTGLFTAPVKGYYRVSASILWISGAGDAGIGAWEVRIRKNGSIDVASHKDSPSQASSYEGRSVSTIVELNSGDTIETFAFNDLGTRDLDATNSYSNTMSINKIQ